MTTDVCIPTPDFNPAALPAGHVYDLTVRVVSLGGGHLVIDEPRMQEPRTQVAHRADPTRMGLALLVLVALVALGRWVASRIQPRALYNTTEDEAAMDYEQEHCH